MVPKNWNEEKIDRLKCSYAKLSKEEIIRMFPEYKWRYLQNLAMSLNVKREYNSRVRGKIEKLLDGSNESFYWLGLIITDGYISEDGELKVELAAKDYGYLNKLANFLETKIAKYPPYKGSKSGATGTCRVKIRDSIYGKKIRELLRIKGKKTYNPVSLDFINNREGWLSLLGGYIDGDGNISKKGKIHIDAHINYYEFMNTFGNKLMEFDIITDFSVIKYKKMCRLSITTYDSLTIKNGLLELGLPIMGRKWDRVSNTKKIKNYLMEHKELILELRGEGKTYKEICEKINYKSIGTLCGFIKNNT